VFICLSTKLKTPTTTKNLLLIVTLLCFGCQPNLEQKYSPKQFESVGIMHNTGLDYVLNSMKLQSSSHKTVSDLLLENQKATLRFLRNENPSLTSAQIGLMESELTKVTSYFDNYIQDAKTARKSVNAAELSEGLIETYIKPNLSNQQYVLFRKVLDVSKKYEEDFQTLESSLNSIQNEVYYLNTEEQPILFQAISVAKSSSKYWQTNRATWESFLSSTSGLASNGRVGATPSNGRIGAMDTAGAVIGGIACAFAGPVGWAFGLQLSSGLGLACSGAMALML
jgi:hypothetical protein